MAGHSKWANIRYRKASQDARRGKVFTKLIREITVSARSGGADQKSNPRLRDAVSKALSANMTRDTIDRAIRRGAGEEGGEQYEEVRYEGYGPAGVAVMADCLTDNRNRTVAEVRHAFSKAGGNLGTAGSVAYLFNKQGIITYGTGDEDVLMEAALGAGAEDITTHDDGSIDIITTAEDFTAVREALAAAGHEPTLAEITMQPATTVDLELEDAERVMRLIDALEELDDVQNVYSNADFSTEIMEHLTG